MLLVMYLQEKNMVNQLNIMLFSDHGMTKIQWMKKVIELDNYINMLDIVKMMDRGPVVNLWPKDNKFQEVRSEYVLLLWCFLWLREKDYKMIHGEIDGVEKVR